MNKIHKIPSIILKSETKFQFHPVVPYNLMHTLNKKNRFGADWYALTPFEIIKDEIYYGGLSLDNFPDVGLKITFTSSTNKLCVSMFTYSRPTNFFKDNIFRLVGHWLGVWEDLNPFYQIGQNHSVIRKSIDHFYGMHETRCINLFETITFCIASQRATGGRTIKIMKNLGENFGKRLKFDNTEVISFPTAKVISSQTEKGLRNVSSLGYRAKYVLFNAKKLQSLRINGILIELLEGYARKKFIKNNFSGLGDYSVEIIDPFGLPLDSWITPLICNQLKLDSSTRQYELVRNYFNKNFDKWGRNALIYLSNLLCES